jgi:Tol biopolymer transport system component
MIRRSTSGRRRAVAGVGTLALLTGVVGVGLDIGPAAAAFPGRNGRIFCNRSVPIPNAPPPPAPQSQTEIFAFNPDGSDPRQLTFDPGTDIEPTVSPDGTRVAWTSTREGGDQEIWIMYQDGSGARRLTFTPGEDRPGTFSPDGTQLAFQTGRFPAPPGPGHSALEIARMNIDASNFVRLTNNNFQDSFAHWSPLGDRIAFTTNRDTPPDAVAGLSNFFEVYTMNATDGSNPVNVTNALGEDSHSHWSPDGSQLTFHSRRDFVPSPGGVQVEIYRSNANGSNPVRLTGPDQLFDIFPVWSPDGTKIAWMHDFPSDVWVMNTDGSSKVNITNTPVDESRCDWSRLLPCTITGAGQILGTAGNDVICGSAGADSIVASGGDDVIYPGGGNDSVSAGGGNDIVFGDHGNDRIFGDAGNDTLFGDQEDDQISGGPGDDIASGSEGNDAVSGADGTDECYAESLRGCEQPAPIP